MTRRAQLFAVAGLFGLLLGLVRGQQVLCLLSLSSLLWIVSEWFQFYWHIRFQLPRIRLARFVNGEGEANRSLWAERTIDVSVQMLTEIRLFGVTLDLLDVVPENLEVISNQEKQTSNVAIHVAKVRHRFDWLFRGFVEFDDNPPNHRHLGLGNTIGEWRYSVRVRSAGNVEFPGFRLTLQSTHGLFRLEKFIKLQQSFRALPSFLDSGEYLSLTKKFNVIPQHGVHQLQRSGMGSELLELREYVSGDPPKSIAWKVSAKRDKWMTRQYESEVPVRVQLFVDGSSQSRVGGFGFRLLDQITFVAASIGRMATNSGDPVGSVMFDERGMRRIPPMSGEKGFQFLLRALSDFSVNPSPPPSPFNQEMMDAALSLMSLRYPELLDFKVNRVPPSLFPVLPGRRKLRRERLLVAGALSEINRLTTREQVQLSNDDVFAIRIQKFLNDSGVPWIAPVISSSERPDRDPNRRMRLLAECITFAVGHARDNEVFVILSDLMSCVKALDHVLPSVKLAIAKHHRVSFVCPTSTFRRPSRTIVDDHSGMVTTDDLLLMAEQAKIRLQAEQIKRELHRCGASVSLSGEKHAIRLIMAELHATRTGRSKFQGAIR